MTRLIARLRGPFASGVLGGLVVAAVGTVAIAMGVVDVAGDDGADATTTALTPAASASGETRAPSVNEIYGRTASGIVQIEASGTGSGFVIDEDGHVLTNSHVVDGADDVEVTLGDEGESLDAEVVGTDPSTDVAVLAVDPSDADLEPLRLGESSEVEVGDQVVAIGNPFGLDRTVTAGIVSAVQREISAPNGFVIRDAIQTDAPINPGSSGGPLLDSAGEVIGVNSQIEATGGQGNVGIGFAVPIDTAREVVQTLIDDGEVEHAFLGISGADLTPEIAGILNLDVERGALVQAVVPDSPADEAEIVPGDAQVTIDGEMLRAGGDVIVRADGEQVGDMGDVIAAVDLKQPGDEIELTLLRGNNERTVTLELAERPASTRP